MTDRIHSLTVVLEKDVRVDDVEAIANSIRMTKGVLSVSEHVSDAVSYMAEERARRELREKILKVLE